MQPKLIFLGTGGDAIVVGKQIRSSGGIILQVEDNQFHIDPGPGAVTRAKDFGINLRNNVAVLVSHNHLNHCNDINAVISAMTFGGLDNKGVLVTNKSVYHGTDEFRPYITKQHKNLIEKSIVLEPGQRVGINEIEIKATRTQHSDIDTIGFKFITPSFTLGYTSDTGYSKELIEDFKDVDILIMNTVNPEDKKDKHQLNVEDVLRILPELKPKLAVMTHFGIKMEENDILSIARNIQRQTKIQTIAAIDGMVLNPVSYSVTQRQKTLNLYKK
jgi:ribonuclease BN (tRNA processing enzyme)